MRILAGTIAVLLAACAPAAPPGAEGASGAEGAADAGVQLSVSPDPAASGETVTLRLRNATEEEIGYNLCTSQLQREAGGGWEPVESDRICTMELRLLRPGGEDTFPIELDQVAAGRYRFLNNVERGGAMQEVASAPFRVR